MSISIDVLEQNAKREVFKTSRYTRFMKNGKCNVFKKTNGNTLHSVNAISQIVYKTLHQVTALAAALKGNTIAETITNNYNFLYQHFQYKADGLKQQMRSPKCSNADRFTGIDCKSFTIYAASLCLSQGIKCIARRVKQVGYNSHYWSHVYLVVPKNQNTLRLSQGYYIIDATLHNNKEVHFTEKHDTIMDKLPHVWLNGGLKNGDDDSVNFNDDPNKEGFDIKKILNVMGFDSGKLKDIFQDGKLMLSCYNSSFTPSKAARMLNEFQIPNVVKPLVNAVENANNTKDLQDALNNFSLKMRNAGVVYRSTLNSNNWRNCSRTALMALAEYYEDMYNKKIFALIGNLRSRFNIQINENSQSKSVLPDFHNIHTPLTGTPFKYKTYTIIGIKDVNEGWSNIGNIKDVNKKDIPESQAGFGSVFSLLLLAGVSYGGYKFYKKNKK